MIYALQRAADELKADIEKYGIIVDPGVGVVGDKDGIIRLNPGTARVICKRYIRSYIKKAKEKEQARHDAKQVSLLDGLA